MSFRHCPNCESKDVIIFERGEDDSYCLECAFTWRQSESFITVSRNVLEQIAGLRASRKKEHEA